MIDRRLDRNWETDNIPYPDPVTEVIDDSFSKYAIFNTPMERIYTGCRWAEGPAWFGDGKYLLFSDIPNNRILRWTEDDNRVSEYRINSNNANGNARDNDGRLITCEHLSRTVTRTERNGSITTLASSFNEKQLNAPNDLVVHKDGAVWFTDPGYGILNNYEGDRSDPLLPTAVYRIDPVTGSVEIKASGMERPNGLCFSPDYSKLYIADSASENPKVIFVYDVVEGGKSLTQGRVFADTGDDSADGIRCDIDGNLWASAQHGTNSISIYNPDSKLIGRIYLPEVPSNLTFGGHKRNRLFITASKSIYAIYTDATGASLS
jgi:gluconolactonase